MSKIFYKVLNPDMTSCCRNYSFPEEYRVKYKINEFVKPNVDGTKLFVFKDLQKAQLFANKEYGWNIYKCEVINPGRVKYLGSLNAVRQFWMRKKKHKKILFTNKMDAPAGTYSCDAVKILENIPKV